MYQLLPFFLFIECVLTVPNSPTIMLQGWSLCALDDFKELII